MAETTHAGARRAAVRDRTRPRRELTAPIRARFEAAREQIRSAPTATVSPAAPGEGALIDTSWPPRVEHRHLTSAVIATALADAGCLWVTGMLDAASIPGLIDGIDRAFAGYDDAEAAVADGGSARGTDWYTAFVPEPGLVHAARPWLRESGGLFTADSPHVADEWFRIVNGRGLRDAVAGYFGESPITSLDKCTLRRIDVGNGIEWHQDGAFLGPENGALNVWATLTDCTDTPGLELVSRRFDDVVETGTGGAGYDWSTGPEVVARLARTAPVVRPAFAAGDALLFDGLLLHRTAQDLPAGSPTRYAIETWFFGPSRFPDHQQVPLAI